MSNKKRLIGKVISDKMNKTCVLNVERLVKHPIYKKYIKKHSNIFFHDEKNICKIGDKVLIEELKPISKKKSWIFLKLISKIKG